MAADAGALSPIGVVGAGTMGAGIAQVAAQAGARVVLYDLEQQFLARGQHTIQRNLERSVQRGRLTEAERSATLTRIEATQSMAALGTCAFVVEAVPEDPQLKAHVFHQLGELCRADTLLVSNTSSLSVTEIGQASGRAAQVAGMHFFNPPGLMRLVEVVRGESTANATIERTVAVAHWLGKTPVVCRDTPGFIVNRVARPYYLEALRIFGSGLADVATIDGALRGVGFPLGPFELMDLIGLDVNFAVTASVFEQRFSEQRFRPHLIQQALVRAGRLGRKSGLGFYDHHSQPPAVALEPIASAAREAPADWERWRAVCSTQAPEVVGRVLSTLINEAYFAVGEGVASAEAIDTAMQLGTNYPRGPFAWAEQVGLDLVLETLLRLDDWYRDGCYAPAPLLRTRMSALSSS